MKTITVFLAAAFVLGSIASANNLAKANIVHPQYTLYKLLGIQYRQDAVYKALSKGKTVVAAYPRIYSFL